MFIIVGLTAIQASNYVPFIPEHKVTENGDFGGWQGIYAGVSMIFLAYIGFDSIAANSAEAINPQRTMPRGILGSLAVALVLFVGVALVLVGMFHYSKYAGNAEPVGWALRQSGHVYCCCHSSYFSNRYVHRFNWYDVSRITFIIFIWS